MHVMNANFAIDLVDYTMLLYVRFYDHRLLCTEFADIHNEAKQHSI